MNDISRNQKGMDLQAQKLKLIALILKLQDENLFLKIEDLICNPQEKTTKIFKQFSEVEVLNRANESDIQYQTGQIKTQEQLKLESDNW